MAATDQLILKGGNPNKILLKGAGAEIINNLSVVNIERYSSLPKKFPCALPLLPKYLYPKLPFRQIPQSKHVKRKKKFRITISCSNIMPLS